MRVSCIAVVVTTTMASASAAATTLTVDLASTIGPARHIASGSLYGVTEKLPADVNGLIAPLRPNVFNNPAAAGAGLQQPVGDAIAVAGRLAPVGAKVSIRLADWFPGWPYNFTNMTDWLSKIDTTVSRRKTAGLTNIYGYEIWNEPNGTWAGEDPGATGTRPVSFNQLWLQTYQHLRQVEPDAKIIGPSTSYYDANFIKSFLTFCKTNNCVPDIMDWHELSGGNLTGNYQSYRSLEQQLGVGPLPISINEYSGKGDLTDEGKPGASAPMIAKFERFQYDSACISYWDVAHPGRLGSLLATDSATNGGWWFYKWYGEMSGNMVATTPPSPNDSAALDGFANVDSTAGRASVLFGGVSDGTIQIVVKGVSSLSFFGTTVRATVEHTPFVNRTTTVTATDTVSSADVAVSGGQITVAVSNANAADGYRLTLTPVGGGTGGARGTGGAPGSGGVAGADAGRDANPGTGGAFADAGGREVGAGGRTGTGGASGTGGSGLGWADAAVDARGGATSGGATGTAGAGGMTTPAASGGAPSTGGATGSGGAGGNGSSRSETGGAISSGGAGSGRGGMGGASSASPTSSGGSTTRANPGSSGCSCRLVQPSARPSALGLLALVLGLWRHRRRIAKSMTRGARSSGEN